MLVKISGKQVRDEGERTQNEHCCSRKCFCARVAKLGVGANSKNEIGNQPECRQNPDCTESQPKKKPEASENLEESKRADEVRSVPESIHEVEDLWRHGEVEGSAGQHDKGGNDREKDCSTTHEVRRYSSVMGVSGIPLPVRERRGSTVGAMTEYAPSPWEPIADHVERYIATNGEDGFLWEGGEVIILTTTGAKSGKERRTPLIRVTDGERYFCVASMGGAPNNPQWFHNMVANPAVTVQDRADVHNLVARVATADEKAKYWSIATAAWPAYDDYQAGTDRDIPLVICEKA